jgi:hypothetical protein
MRYSFRKELKLLISEAAEDLQNEMSLEKIKNKLLIFAIDFNFIQKQKNRNDNTIQIKDSYND